MEENYEQFGKEWVKELIKYPKSYIIELYRKQCIANLKQIEEIKLLEKKSGIK